MGKSQPSTLFAESSTILRRKWSEERSYRVGIASTWIGLVLTSVAVIFNSIYAGVIEVTADFVLMFGCALSLYLTHLQKPKRNYVWWPFYIGFLAAIIPSTWLSGGIYSPWLGLYLAVLAVMGSVVQAHARPYLNMFWLILYLIGWMAIGYMYPQKNIGYLASFPPLFMMVATGICLLGIGYCLNSLLKTERILTFETEQRYVELFEARAHLLREESANQAKSTFLANISHELRTPLGAVLGYANLLQDKATTPEEKALFAQTIERNGRQLARLVDDLLDLSKVEAGRIELENLDCKITDLISEVLNLLDVDAKKKLIRLSVRMLSPVPETIRTDPVRFKQILTNIVGNAVKFTERGQIEILLRYESGPGSELFLTVKDSGRGIALSERDKLFKPFSQADASMTRRYGGTGLGLNFSRELSRLLGGDLDLSWSQLGVGSEFTFHFPVVVPSDSAMIQQFLDPVRSLRETPPSLPPFDFSNIHILVVDDAPENRDIIGRYLAPTGARVDEASDGIQCIQMVETHHYDLILMDIQMPGLDGLQATSILRQKLFASPIIAITAHAMKEDRVRCIEAGCTDHLAKPLKKQDLMQMIELHRPTSITKAFRPNEVTF